MMAKRELQIGVGCMRKVVLYARAFGLVMKRRLEKRRMRRMAERENQIVKWGNEEKKKGVAYFYYALGGVAIAAVTCSGIILYRTLYKMQNFHAMNAVEEETQESLSVQEPMTITEVAPDDTTAEAKDIVIEEQDIPLTASYIEPDSFEQLSFVEVTGVSALASSVLQSEKNKSYEAENLLDGNPASNWQEGEEGNGEGTVLTFQFEEPVEISGIELLNGNGVSEQKYFANNRPKTLTIQLGTRKVNYTLNDQFGSQFIELSPCGETKELAITIDSVYEGDKYEDTCISDIKFYCLEE